MRKIICYGFENGKLWFGYVTLWSLIASYFRDGRFLEVKPIKHYEKYAYYKDVLMVDWHSRYYNFTNYKNYNTPFWAIAYAENKTVREIVDLPSIH